VKELIREPERLSAMLMDIYMISDAVAIDHCGQEPQNNSQQQSST
jgi:hypothetical protein